MTVDEFMDSTFYYYYGLMEQHLLANGAKRKTRTGIAGQARNDSGSHHDSGEEKRVYTFDELPDGVW